MDTFIAKPAYSPSLEADVSALSAATGGQVHFILDAGTWNASRAFLLLGSFTGTSPGTVLPGGSVLPLNRDGFTNLVMGMLNSPYCMNFRASLDGYGRGTALFDTHGPLPSGMAGLTMSDAFTVEGVAYASNPLNIPITPWGRMAMSPFPAADVSTACALLPGSATRVMGDMVKQAFPGRPD